MLQLLRLFQEDDWQITFTSTAQQDDYSTDLADLGIKTTTIQLNHASFDDLLLKLNPKAVLFDRFMTEEQFGWRLVEHCPDAVRLLDTEDLHCLRKAREEAIANDKPFQFEMLLDSELAKRELASIYRCDLSLMISEVEMDILQNLFKVDESLLQYVPFMVTEVPNRESLPSFEERGHFVTIGNFMHAPNWDSVLQLKQQIWPLIRQQLPDTELHVYGAYPPKKVMRLHNEAEGFLIKGWAKDVRSVMQRARVCLAPLRFGAGLKGKLLDAMIHGTPSVTTLIGAEGMHGNLPWPGSIVDDTRTFVERSLRLYTDKEAWHLAQQLGQTLIEERFLKGQHTNCFTKRMADVCNTLKVRRQQNFTGAMLQHHKLQSTKYMAKWIEEKNK